MNQRISQTHLRFSFPFAPLAIPHFAAAILAIVRDAIVACFGLKTAKHLATLSGEANADRIGIFKVYSKSETEIVLGEDDKHLRSSTKTWMNKGHKNRVVMLRS